MHTIVNICRTHLLSLVNSVSVWWHVVGVAAIVAGPGLRPRHPPELQLRLRPPDQQQRLQRQACYWFYVLPLGFLLTQYTITGFDASAHISEETHGASESAREGGLEVDLLLGA